MPPRVTIAKLWIDTGQRKQPRYCKLALDKDTSLVYHTDLLDDFSMGADPSSAPLSLKANVSCFPPGRILDGI